MAALRRRGYATDPLAFAGTLESDPSCSADAMRLELAREAPASGSLVVGAFSPGLIGLLGVVREQPGKFVHKARLWGFYVEPLSRRRGVGRLLLTEAARRARGLGVEQLTLRVCTACEAAIASYEAFGFERFGCEPRALKVGPSYFDELHMLALLGALPGGARAVPGPF